MFPASHPFFVSCTLTRGDVLVSNRNDAMSHFGKQQGGVPNLGVRDRRRGVRTTRSIGASGAGRELIWGTCFGAAVTNWFHPAPPAVKYHEHCFEVGRDEQPRIDVA